MRTKQPQDSKSTSSDGGAGATQNEYLFKMEKPPTSFGQFVNNMPPARDQYDQCYGLLVDEAVVEEECGGDGDETPKTIKVETNQGDALREGGHPRGDRKNPLDALVALGATSSGEGIASAQQVAGLDPAAMAMLAPAQLLSRQVPARLMQSDVAH